MSYGDGDFLDVFEQYGFFDTSATVHTAEVVVPSRLANTTSCEWRRQLMWTQSKSGFDAAHEAWWVPDHQLDACPLFAALRAAFLPEAERDAALADLTWLRRPLRNSRAESAARTKMALLLSTHLAGYDTSLQQDERELQERASMLGAQELQALRLLCFEKRLLSNALRELRQ